MVRDLNSLAIGTYRLKWQSSLRGISFITEKYRRYTSLTEWRSCISGADSEIISWIASGLCLAITEKHRGYGVDLIVFMIPG